MRDSVVLGIAGGVVVIALVTLILMNNSKLSDLSKRVQDLEKA